MSQHAMIELGALLGDYLLGLVLIAGTGPHTDRRAVQWVHSSDLADPSPFLTPRTVLLTTGSQFSDDLEDDEAEEYVARLQAAGTAALGIAVGIRWDRIPAPLITACDALHLPLFRVPYDTPFIAIVRTAARLLEAEQHANEQREGESDQPRRIVSRHDRLAASERALRRAVLRLLVEGRPELAQEIAAGSLPRLPHAPLSAMIFEEPVTAQFLSEISPVITATDGMLSSHLMGRTTVLAEQSHLAHLRRILSRNGVASGISERGTVPELAELIEQAERALRIASAQESPGPVDYRPAMHAGVLQLLRDSPEAIRRAQGLLSPLRTHDARHQDRLEESVRTWLAHHGQTSSAAAELGVHRHTLRTRVSTAASLLQRDLDDPDTRAELWAALRLGESAERRTVAQP